MRPGAVVRFVHLALAIACATSSGCGWAALTHDQMLGPVSPAGRLHRVVVGSGFYVTDTGPVARQQPDALFRAVPADIIQRLGAPSSFYALIKGMQALIASFSPVMQRDADSGRFPDDEAIAAIPADARVDDVLEALGPPESWIQRKTGSLLMYRAAVGRRFSFYIGVPPLVGALIPVPGIGNLRFRYGTDEDRARKLLLRFDPDGRLRSISTSEGSWPVDE